MAAYRQIYLSFLLLLSIFPASQVFAEVEEFIANHENILAVVIFDKWSGFSPTSPQQVRYYLVRQDKQFKGFATVSFGSATQRRTRILTDIEIPASKVKKALNLLQGLRLEQTEYEPHFTATDAYPDLTIVFDAGSEQLILKSRSQGEKMTPWKVTGGVTNSTAPFEVWQMLKPFLRRDEVEALRDEVSARGWN